MNAQAKLQSGYAFTSTRRAPLNPETVIVGTAEVDARHVGWAIIDGSRVNIFKVRGKRRYYFQTA